MSNGKGSRARPLAVDQRTYAENWDRTFRSQSEHSIHTVFPKTTLVERTDFETIDLTKTNDGGDDYFPYTILPLSPWR